MLLVCVFIGVCLWTVCVYMSAWVRELSYVIATGICLTSEVCVCLCACTVRYLKVCVSEWVDRAGYRTHTHYTHTVTPWRDTVGLTPKLMNPSLFFLSFPGTSGCEWMCVCMWVPTRTPAVPRLTAGVECWYFNQCYLYDSDIPRKTIPAFH